MPRNSRVAVALGFITKILTTKHPNRLLSVSEHIDLIPRQPAEDPEGCQVVL